jgi:TetR/AcrR family transcriptional regulator, cholesterol catabolism regulator
MAERKRTNTIKNKNDAGTVVRKMSRDPAKGEHLRRKVYDAVVKTLLKRRSGSFTLDEIAAQIGGSKGIIYYYFKSKGDVLYKLNLYFMSLLLEGVKPIIEDSTLSAREKLEAVIRDYVTTSCRNWQLSSVLWSDIALGEVTAGQARAITKARRQYINQLAVLAQEIILGDGLEKVDPKVAALMIFGLVVSFSTWYKKGGKLTPGQVAEYAVKMTFHGILSKKPRK